MSKPTEEQIEKINYQDDLTFICYGSSVVGEFIGHKKQENLITIIVKEDESGAYKIGDICNIHKSFLRNIKSKKMEPNNANAQQEVRIFRDDKTTKVFSVSLVFKTDKGERLVNKFIIADSDVHALGLALGNSWIGFPLSLFTVKHITPENVSIDNKKEDKK